MRHKGFPSKIFSNLKNNGVFPMKALSKKKHSPALRAIIQLVAMLLLIGVDRLIKMSVEQNLRPIGKLPLIDGFIGLSYVQNTGAAFGSFSGYTQLLSIFTALIILVGTVLMIAGERLDTVFKLCLPLIMAGGAGNLIDRLIQGYVTDYIELQFVSFPVFNFADCLVTGGCFAVLVYLVYSMLKERSSGRSKASDKEASE